MHKIAVQSPHTSGEDCNNYMLATYVYALTMKLLNH